MRLSLQLSKWASSFQRCTSADDSSRKIGDWQRCLACLNAYKSWHLQKGTYLFLREKLEVICWRNLTRKT